MNTDAILVHKIVLIATQLILVILAMLDTICLVMANAFYVQKIVQVAFLIANVLLAKNDIEQKTENAKNVLIIVQNVLSQIASHVKINII